jgi:hypothetical protein
MEITTDKQAFDYVVKMLLEQGEKSMDDSETCQYRGFKPKTLEDTLTKAQEIAHSSDETYWSSDIDDLQRDLLANLPCDAKCAVGHLIKDEHYDSYIEGETMTTDVVNMVKLSHPNWAITDGSQQMMIELQKIHDGYPSTIWGEMFKTFQYNFTENGRWIIDGKD